MARPLGEPAEAREPAGARGIHERSGKGEQSSQRLGTVSQSSWRARTRANVDDGPRSPASLPLGPHAGEATTFATAPRRVRATSTASMTHPSPLLAPSLTVVPIDPDSFDPEPA